MTWSNVVRDPATGAFGVAVTNLKSYARGSVLPFAKRMLEATHAGQAAGGDKRGLDLRFRR